MVQFDLKCFYFKITNKILNILHFFLVLIIYPSASWPAPGLCVLILRVIKMRTSGWALIRYD